MHSSKVAVAETFITYAEAALIRARYILPGVQIEYDKENHEFVIHEFGDHRPEEVTKEINYALYREKIYQETLPIRSKILGV